jgi:DNA-binding SARP family transcriptional activator/tetratricopeptide (TPR) repeat protein
LLRLKTLGGLSVERLDGPSSPTTVTSARRRLALLAVLAASDSAALPRDKLLALFWPDSDMDRARHALDQTLYALKRNLGVESLVVGREELALDAAVISSDVRALRDALSRRDFKAAVELYSGPFLDGVFISGSPEFDQWADGERRRLAGEMASAMESLAGEAASSGDHRAAADWWRRCAAQDPTDARVVLALMSALAASGDSAAAVRQAELYHALLRADGDVEANPAVAALADRLRKSPAVIPSTREGLAAQERKPSPVLSQVIAQRATPVRMAPPAARRSTPLRLGDPNASALRRRAVRRFRATGIAAAIIVAGLSIAWALVKRGGSAPPTWVLPADLENRTRDSMFDHTLDAALRAGLEQSAYVTVFPTPRIRQTLTRMARVPDRAGSPPLDEALAREVAQREGIPIIVASAIDRVDSNYILTARLLEPRTGRSLWTDKVVANRRGGVIDALDELVRRLRRKIGESPSMLAKHDRPLPEATTRSLEALREFADGIAALRADQRPAAIKLWEAAVATDSDFALAHAQLGAAYYFGNDRPRGDAHFDRALALANRLSDRERLSVQASAESWRGNREEAINLRRAILAEFPDDPTVWPAIGYDYLRLGRHVEAAAAYRRQLTRDPNDATALVNLALVLDGPGQLDESIRTYRRAFALLPAFLTNSIINNEYGTRLIRAGRVAEARAAFAMMFQGDKDAKARGHRSTGLLSMLQGQYGDAIMHFRQAVVLTQQPGLTQLRNRLFLASAEQERGWRDSARAELRIAYELFHQSYVEPGFLMYLGKALVRDSQLVIAAEVLDSLGRRARPGNPVDQANLQVLAAEVALARGSADSAVRLLRRAAAADSSAFVLESLAHALAGAGDLTSAAKVHESIGSDPTRWFGYEAEQFALVAWRNAGQLYERMHDYRRARDAYERQLTLWTRPDSDLVSLRDARDGLLRAAHGTLQPSTR